MVAVHTTVPPGGSVLPLTVREPPSTSVSLVSTGIGTGAPASVVAVSSTETGASLTGVTVMVTVAVPDWSEPSVAR